MVAERAPIVKWTDLLGWWRDDANFQSILPAPLAARLRPWLYGGCIAAAAGLVLLVLPVTVNVPGVALAVGLLAALYQACTPAPEPRRPLPDVCYRNIERAAYTGETVRLGDDIEEVDGAALVASMPSTQEWVG